MASGLILGGCQGTPPKPSPKRSPSTTPDRTKPQTPPVMPRIASQRSEAGARAFALYYYNLVNYGRATEKWDPLRNLSLSDCRACADFWKPKPSRMNNEKQIHVREPRISRYEPDRDRVTVGLDVTTQSPPDKPTLGKKGVTFSDLVDLVYRDNRWKVKEIDWLDPNAPPDRK